MMKTSRVPGTLAATSVAAVLVLTGCTAAESDTGGEGVTLTVSYPATEDHAHTRTFLAFAEEVTARTGGEVSFEHHYSESLCQLPEAIECTGNGTVDISFATHAYTPELGLANLSSTAFVSKDLQASADAHNQLQREDEAFQAEFDDRGVQILFHLANSAPLVALNSEIDSLADLEGMSLRAAGSMAAAVEGLGANAVATAPAEIYESVERGVVEGLVLPLESIIDFRFHEVAPHIYDIGEYVGLYAMSAYAINRDVWEGLPEDVRTTMREVAAEITPTVVEDFLIPFIAETCATAAADGATVEAVGPAAAGESWAAAGREAQVESWIGTAQVEDPEAAARSYLDLYESLAGEPTRPTYQICADAS